MEQTEARGSKILVVDDERIVAQDIIECLEGMGCDVCDTALSGAEAIEKANIHRPDLVMMDITLQGEMDGVEAATAIRQRYDIASVFLTAYSDPTILARAKACEPAGYIVKPFEEAGLRSTVEIALYKIQVDRRVRENEKWFHTTLMSIGDAVISTNAAGEVRFMNRVAIELTGWTEEQASGRHIEEVFPIFHENTKERVPNPLLRALKEGRSCGLDPLTILVRPNRTSIPIDDSAAPITTAEGEITGAVLVFRDVTATRAAELEVQRHQEHLEELVEARTSQIQNTNAQLVEEVAVRSRTEKSLELRVAMENLTASISRAFLNRKPAEADNGLNEALAQIAKFLNVPAAYVYRYSDDGQTAKVSHAYSAEGIRTIVTAAPELPIGSFAWWQLQLAQRNLLYIPDGAELPAEAHQEREFIRGLPVGSILAVPMKESERVLGFVGVEAAGEGHTFVAEDASLLRMVSSIFHSALSHARSEQDKELLQEQLGQSQKMEAVGKLSGGIAHDFNNMLLPIIGYSDMLMDTLEVDDPRAKDLGEIRKAAERAAALTRQLLAFSRKQVISKDVFSITECIVNIEAMLRPIIGEDVDFDISLDPRSLSVLADIGQIEQVIMNLVVNARDAMPTGGKIRVETGNLRGNDPHVQLISDDERRENYVFIRVSDSGCGMDEKLIARIFEPFYTTKGLDGTGLGLSVVYGILEQHGGGVRVDSEIGRGTSFSIFLPAVPARAVEQRKKEIEEGVNARGDGQHILLVEDEEGVSRFVSIALRNHGYEVTTAANVRDARSAYEESGESFDMIFSDAVLPDGNGVQLLDEILEKRPGTRALLSSGYTDKHNVIKLLQQKTIAFLQKPYSLPQLLTTVHRVIHGNCKTQEYLEDSPVTPGEAPARRATLPDASAEREYKVVPETETAPTPLTPSASTEGG